MYTTKGFEADSLDELQNSLVDFYFDRDGVEIPWEEKEFIYNYNNNTYLSIYEVQKFFDKTEKILGCLVTEQRKDRGVYEYI